MSWVDAIRLGRVSNLPTVWTNALAGIVLAGGSLRPAELILLFAAVSLAYVGGMFLNDAFDAEIDSRQRPDRPIPAGRVTREAVITAGSAMLAGSVLGLGLIGFAKGTGLWAGLAGTVLAGLILLYDWHHKANPLSPVVMGLCRVMVYVAAGVCVTHPLPGPLWIGAALVLCHLIGLTYAAKQENLADPGNLWPLVFLAAPLVYGLAFLADRPAVALFWVALAVAVLASLFFLRRRSPGDVPRAIMILIAAISLLDALLIAGHGRAGLAIIAALGFVLTLALQRFVRGT